MTAPEPTRPADEHTDAVARLLWTPVHTDVGPRSMYFDECAAAILTSTDAAVHAAIAASLPVIAASLPAEVRIASLTDAEMLAALVDRGALTAEDAPIARHGGYEHTHWQQRWDGQHTHEGRRFVTPWQVAP